MEFQTLYQELVASTEMIKALLAGIHQEEAQIKPKTDAWSILEVVCHLYDEECKDFREHLDLILNRQADAWHEIHPTEWVNERKYNQQNFIEMQDKFFSERWKSQEWLKGLSNANWDTEYTSPFGSIKAGDMFASWIAHDNLHIRQLVELRQNLIERITTPYNIQYAGDW
jgi:uncharacterized damage-inducible protein DinB